MSPRAAVVIAFAVAFVALAYEIIWFRLFSFISWGAPATFGLLLGFYLMGIVAGTARIQRFAKSRELEGSAETLGAVGGLVVAASIAGYLVAPGLALIGQRGNWLPAFGLVAVGAGLSGAVFPLLAHATSGEDKTAGKRIAALYVANIAGSALGGFVTSYLFLDWAPLRVVSAGLLICGVIAGTYLLGRSPRGSPTWNRTGTPVLLGLFAWVISIPIYGTLYERLLFRENYASEIHFARTLENKHGVINVTNDGHLYGGGTYDGMYNTRLENDRNGVVRVYALAGMVRTNRNVLVIGLGSGSWAAILAQFPGIERMTIVEINPGYADILPEHPEVASLRRDPRVRWVFADGRQWLARHTENFDLIVMNTTFHSRAQSTSLLSKEFMALVRTRLSECGVFYFNTTQSLDAVKTTLGAFPAALRVGNALAASECSFRFDVPQLLRRLEPMQLEGRPALPPAIAEGFHRYAETGESSWPMLRVTEREALKSESAEARVITDDNMATEWRFPPAFPTAPKPEHGPETTLR